MDRVGIDVGILRVPITKVVETPTPEVVPTPTDCLGLK